MNMTLEGENKRLRARIRELEDGLRECLEYITCCMPSMCDERFAKDIDSRLLDGR